MTNKQFIFVIGTVILVSLVRRTDRDVAVAFDREFFRRNAGLKFSCGAVPVKEIRV